MKKSLFIIVFILCLIIIQAFADEKTIIGVFDLEPLNISQSDAVSLTDRVRDYLVQAGNYTVVERRRMQDLFSELGIQQCTSSKCVLDVGKRLGAQLLIVGSVSLTGKLYTVSLRIIDGETGAIVATGTAGLQGSIERVATETTQEAVLKLLKIYQPKKKLTWLYLTSGAVVIVTGAIVYLAYLNEQKDGTVVIKVPSTP